MFTSDFDHAIDAKSRLFLPVKYREIVGSSVWLGKWFEHNLYMMDDAGWHDFETKVMERVNPTEDRDLIRYLFSNVQKIALDAQGRILIPPSFMTHAGLTDKAKIIGCGNKAEIWSPEIWEKYNSTVDLNKLMGKLGGIGV